jgi:hypothetical protein
VPSEGRPLSIDTLIIGSGGSEGQEPSLGSLSVLCSPSRKRSLIARVVLARCSDAGIAAEQQVHAQEEEVESILGAGLVAAGRPRAEPPVAPTTAVVMVLSSRRARIHPCGQPDF